MPFSQGHALLVGVGAYQMQALNVPIAVTDVQAVAEVLRDPQTCGYPDDQLSIVVDEQATSAGVLAALDALAARAGPDDTVFLFYVGHGAMGTDGNYYLVSHDAKIEGGRVAAGTGISQQALIDKLRQLRAQRVLLLFNTCHSGEISPSFGEAPTGVQSTNPPEATSFAMLGTGKGRIIITACREEQVSYIGKGARSYFTQALVDGLRGKGIVPRGGTISAFDLYTYLFETVTEKVDEEVHRKQEPELTIIKGVGPFAVCLYAGATVTNLGLAEEPAELPTEAPVRQVKPEKAQRLAQSISQIRTENQSGGVNISGGNVHVGGDIVGRDKITKSR